jgi:hypothetical protein
MWNWQQEDVVLSYCDGLVYYTRFLFYIKVCDIKTDFCFIGFNLVPPPLQFRVHRAGVCSGETSTSGTLRTMAVFWDVGSCSSLV